MTNLDGWCGAADTWIENAELVSGNIRDQVKEGKA
jgi:hypothetical protein